MIPAHPAVEHRDGRFGAAADCARVGHGAPVVYVSAPARARCATCRCAATSGVSSAVTIAHGMIEAHPVVFRKIVTFCRVKARSLVRESAVLLPSVTSNSVPRALGARHAHAHTWNAAFLVLCQRSVRGWRQNRHYSVCDNNYVLGRHSWSRLWILL